MGISKKTGIIAGVIVAIFLYGIVEYADSFYDDAHSAELRATYFDDTDRLAVAIVLTKSDGAFTEANGHIEIAIKKGGQTVYSNVHDFTKDDFFTWDNLFGGQTRGAVFTIDERFPGGDYDVFANVQTKSGYWEGLHATFNSLE